MAFWLIGLPQKAEKNGRKEAVLELEKLQKSYRKNEVLQDVSITVKDGESVCFVGANGAGKSTLLKIIVGALKPDAGTILWNGKAVDGTFLSEHVGYVPQENPLFEDLTVKDNLELWYANDKARLQKDLEDGWLFYFGMHKIYKKPVKKLSGGMKKRLSICCALAGDPDVLVMDEPGAALDLMAKNEILRLIKNFTRKGKSVIITSHEMSEITFCHSLYGIRDGCTVTLDKEINGFELTEWIQG
ncbi:ABC transporter ATP-binding protein [Clostridium sp. AF37-5]|nr:ABC transporter ATP-binding protein [Clostridium sp. AF37-5]